MTLEEFVRLSPKQIRSDERLMQLYVKFHEAAFSFTPKCTGCSFKSGFEKLRRYSTKGEKKITKFGTMEAKTFKLKKKYWNKILTFKKSGITYRKYGNNIDEVFARELVASGQEDLFDKLPKVSKGKHKVELHLKDGTKEIYGIEEGLEVSEYKSPYKEMDYRKELLPLYAEISEATGKFAKSKKKNDVIAFLLENED